jgi:hypothetical protein
MVDDGVSIRVDNGEIGVVARCDDALVGERIKVGDIARVVAASQCFQRDLPRL